MIYLILSILVNALLILAFQWFNRWRINNQTAITFNYVTASLCGFILTGSVPHPSADSVQPWFTGILLMGVLFIGLFNLIAYTTVHSGVSVAAVSNKMSVVIPVLAATYLYQEKVTAFQAIGIGLAMLAVLLVSLKEGEGKSIGRHGFAKSAPVVLFLGCGLLDSLINFIQFRYINSVNTAPFLLSYGFMIAGCIGLPIWLFRMWKGDNPNPFRSAIAGLLLGIPNFLSIWLMMKALESKVMNASSFFPVNNAGVVLVSSISSALIFSEAFSNRKKIGIVMAIIAIALIAFF